MALFVQIDHFRKTDQKPTVKNHLFSISWFRSFNRTSFQQQLKQRIRRYQRRMGQLQSYILSTTTETEWRNKRIHSNKRFNRTSFQQQLKHKVLCQYRIFTLWLQSYILSTTTETKTFIPLQIRHDLLQSYILSTTTETLGARNVQEARKASIVHPFNNN